MASFTIAVASVSGSARAPRTASRAHRVAASRVRAARHPSRLGLKLAFAAREEAKALKKAEKEKAKEDAKAACEEAKAAKKAEKEAAREAAKAEKVAAKAEKAATKKNKRGSKSKKTVAPELIAAVNAASESASQCEENGELVPQEFLTETESGDKEMVPMMRQPSTGYESPVRSGDSFCDP